MLARRLDDWHATTTLLVTGFVGITTAAIRRANAITFIARIADFIVLTILLTIRSTGTFARRLITDGSIRTISAAVCWANTVAILTRITNRYPGTIVFTIRVAATVT